MARGVLLALVVAALGFGVWMVMGDQRGGAPDALDDIGSSAGPVADMTTGPTLIARGRAAPEDEVATGHPWGVSVLVLDVEGRPAPDVRVTLRFSQPRWDYQGYDPASRRAYAEWQRHRLRRSLERLDDPFGEEVRAEGRTGSDGRARLESRGPGYYYVEAHPELPVGGARAHVEVEADKSPDDVTLRLRDLVEVEGRVVDTNGRGVVASLTPNGLSGSSGWRGERVESDGEGRFVVYAPAGPLHLSVRLGSQVVLASRGHEVPSAKPLEIVVPLLDAELDVTVVDPGGSPVAGAVVQVTTRDAWSVTLLAETGVEGSARFLAPTGAVASVGVEAPPWLRHDERTPLAEWAPLALSAAQPAKLRVTLQAGGVVHGVVRAGAGGAGLDGATVRLMLAQGAQNRMGWMLLEGVSDAAGRYRIEGVPLGRHLLYATHAEWFHAAVDLASAGSPPPAEATFVLLEPGAEVERDLVMQPGAVLQGIVVDHEGRPVADARIHRGPSSSNVHQAMWQWGMSPGYYSMAPVATSDAEGRFRLARPPGSEVVLGAVAEEGASRYCEAIRLEEGGAPAEIRLVVERGGTVRGRVLRGSEREPVADAILNNSSTDQRTYPSVQRKAKTDAEGRFELKGLPAVAQQITAYVTGTGERVRKQVAAPEAGSVVEDVELLVGSGHELVLVLVDEKESRPLADQTFTLQGHEGGWTSGTTDAEGKATLQNVAAGTYSVSLTGGDASWTPQASAVQVPSTGPVMVRMRRQVQNVLVGRVLQPDGTPVPLCTVSVSSSSTTRNVVYPMGYGGGTLVVGGTFRVLATTDPPYQIQVGNICDADGQALALRAPEHAVTAEEVAAGPIVVRLEASGQALLRIVGDEGEPLASGWARDVAGGSYVQIPPDGRVRFGNLASEGTIRVHVQVPGYRQVNDGYEVPIGDTETVIRLERGGTIRGRVDWGDSAPESSGISANWNTDGKQGWAHAQVEPDGSFVLGGLPDRGVVTIQLTAASRREAGVARMSVERKDVPVGARDVVLHADGGLVLAGRVVDAAGQGVEGSPVYVTDSGRQSVNLVSGADGAFEVRGLAPGTASVRAHRNHQHTLIAQVQAEAGARSVEVRLPAVRTLAGQLSGGRPPYKLYAVRALAKGPAKGLDKGPAPTASVEADGSFSLPLPDDGRDWDLWVVGTGASHYGHLAGVDGRELVTIGLLPGGTIDGRVEGLEAGDAAHLWIMASNELGVSTYTRLREDATWSLTGLPPGSWKLHLSGRGGYKIEPLEGIENGTTGLVVRASK
ncbi:MAG: carboxypeptidase regulatory-like domain-containing protein [Planctomycetota bacterium]